MPKRTDQEGSIRASIGNHHLTGLSQSPIILCEGQDVFICDFKGNDSEKFALSKHRCG